MFQTYPSMGNACPHCGYCSHCGRANGAPIKFPSVTCKGGVIGSETTSAASPSYEEERFKKLVDTYEQDQKIKGSKGPTL